MRGGLENLIENDLKYKFLILGRERSNENIDIARVAAIAWVCDKNYSNCSEQVLYPQNYRMHGISSGNI